MTTSVYQRCTDPSCPECMRWFGPAPTEVRTSPIIGWNTTNPHAVVVEDTSYLEEWDEPIIYEDDDETDMSTRGHDILSEEIE